jgi:hypothetical protein
MIIKDKQQLIDWIDRFKTQAEVMLEYNPIKIEFEVYRQTRTLQQNKYMWSVFQHIADFYQETGFMPDRLEKNLKFFNKDVAKVWFSAKYDIHHTSTTNTKEMVDFIDSVQNDMIQQTKGEYEPIYPEIIIE